MTEASQRPRQARTPRAATIGAAASANKGAASMLQAVLDRLPEAVPGVAISVLTTYPDVDRALLADADVEVVPATPRSLVIPTLPLALLIAVLRTFRLPTRWAARTPALRVMLDADVVVDLAGISFVDGRGFPILVYNTIMTGIPLLLGRPVIKASQATGPHRRPLTRLAASLVLRRVRWIGARGEGTASHLVDLGGCTFDLAEDLAFQMDADEQALAEAQALLPEDPRPTVCVVPSAVVQGYATQHGQDHAADMAAYVNRLLGEGYRVVLLAHSARPGKPASRMNDLPLCAEIAASVGPEPGLLFLDGSHRPQTLRAIIGRCDVLVTSRFHAMISGLATVTPTFVVGWSHKYEEVLSQFGLSAWAIDHASFDVDTLVARTAELHAASDEVRAAIRANLDTVRAGANVSIDRIADVLLERA